MLLLDPSIDVPKRMKEERAKELLKLLEDIEKVAHPYSHLN